MENIPTTYEIKQFVNMAMISNHFIIIMIIFDIEKIFLSKPPLLTSVASTGQNGGNGVSYLLLLFYIVMYYFSLTKDMMSLLQELIKIPSYGAGWIPVI